MEVWVALTEKSKNICLRLLFAGRRGPWRPYVLFHKALCVKGILTLFTISQDKLSTAMKLNLEELTTPSIATLLPGFLAA